LAGRGPSAVQPAERGRDLNILIVHAHPSERSFNATLKNCAVRVLGAAGHQLRQIDLCAHGFDPVMARDEWHTYFTKPEKNRAAVQDHIDALIWAEALCLIYPTWNYGPPAILKGWFERVFLPGVAFEVPDGNSNRIKGKLTNIRQLIVITTSGSPWWWMRLIGDPGRAMILRGMRGLFHPRCKRTWLQLHSMDRATEVDRARFLLRVEGKLLAL